jgi:hypothetical protein
MGTRLGENLKLSNWNKSNNKRFTFIHIQVTTIFVIQ